MLKVYLTTDVEIWCNDWHGLDHQFRAAFERYIYGATEAGEFGLRYQASVLRDHGLRGVFFVEPLFSGRFGLDPLSEVVAILRERGQEVQLHLHTEWVDEWPEPLFPGMTTKQQYLHYFSRANQAVLIAEGIRRLKLAGADRVDCFRAGGFGFNVDTLDALSSCKVPFDASYNAVHFGLDSGVAPGVVLNDVYCERGVTEFPTTVFSTGWGRLRHVQLGACSSAEIEHLLWAALESKRQAFVLLSHNFELLTPSKRSADPVVVSRFQRLCRFLDRHRDVFKVCGFRDQAEIRPAPQREPLSSSAWRTAWRVAEQVYRRRYA